MRTIAIINQKGGCGKTTTAINLSAVFARKGFRTLLVDMDPQGHCAAGLGIPESSIERDVTDVLLTPDSRPLDAEKVVWRVTRGLDLVPSRMRLAGLEASRGGLASLPEKEHRLARAIARLNETTGPEPMPRPEPGEEPRPGRYDVCLIDCPPSIGLLTFNALAAAREILVPVETSYFSLQGATKQVSTVRSIARRLGVRIRPHVLATIHDASIPLAKDLLRELKDRFGSTVIPSVIRQDPVLKEAASFGRPVIDHAPDAPSAEDYLSLCEWLVEHADIERGDLVDDVEPGPVEVLAPEPRVPEVVTITKPEPAAEPEDRAPSRLASRLEELSRRARAMQGPVSKPTPAPEAAPVAPVMLSQGPADSSVLPMVLPGRAPVRPMAAPTATQPTTPEPVEPPIVETRSRTFPSAPTARRVSPLPAPKPADRPEAAAGVATGDAATATAAPRTKPSLRATLGKPVVLELVETEPVEVLDSVRRLFGCRATAKGALFVQPATIGTRVQIAGEFNGWRPERATMVRNEGLGVFELRLDLPPGAYRYRLVIDGRWCTDEHNPERVWNAFGEADNLLRVPRRSA
ncbi:MAG: AAA family ATPase [Phycisphaerales bacterium]